MKIVFMGTPEFAVPSLKALIENGYDVRAVVTQPDKPKGRGNKMTPPPVKELALQYGIDVLQPEKVKTTDFVNKIKEYEPDLLVTCAYGKILSEDTLNAAPLGCINVHASLLPKYRGAAPLWWAVINGEKESGITTMYTDVGMDTGDILLKKSVPIDDDMTTGELSEQLSHLGAEVLLETLEKLKNGTLERTPQDHSKATYSPMINKDNACIDWNKGSREIHNLVRGMNPTPVAFTYYKNDRMKVYKTKLLNSDESEEFYSGISDKFGNVQYDSLQPGTILAANKEGLFIKTGDGVLQAIEVQFDSSKRMTVRDYLLGHTLEVGVQLGDTERVK